MIMRLENWEEKLALFLISRQTQAFVWGTNDCILFAADAVKETTGVDLAAEVRGAYNSESTAALILNERGGLEAAITTAFGYAPHTAWAKTHRGDVVLAQAGGTLCAGVSVGDGQIAVPAPTAKNIVRLPLNAARKIWSF
jgi:hypothetical protein